MPRMHAQERRELLLAAAREEFLRVGPDGARISDIADRAGVNVALLYRYFESKEQMFEEAIVEPLDHLLSEMFIGSKTYGSNSSDITESIYTFYRSLLEVFAETFELFGVVLFSGRVSGHEFYQRRIVPFIDTVANQVRDNGDWQQHVDPAITTPICVGMCWGVTMDAHFRDAELNLDEVSSVLVRMTMHGLLGSADTSSGAQRTDTGT